VTSLVEFSTFITPALAQFQALHPDLTVRFLAGGRLFRLEYGEAHVAIRASRMGAPPAHPDNVVQSFARMTMRLVCAASYIERYGLPNADNLAQHRFVGIEEGTTRAPFNDWLAALVPATAIRFRVDDSASLLDAIRAGAGIGFMPSYRVKDIPEMTEVLPHRPEWSTDFHLVTHVDLHRSPKVQALLNHLKSRVKGWGLS